MEFATLLSVGSMARRFVNTLNESRIKGLVGIGSGYCVRHIQYYIQQRSLVIMTLRGAAIIGVHQSNVSKLVNQPPKRKNHRLACSTRAT